MLNSACYLTKQGFGLWEQRRSAVSTSALLQDPSLEPGLRELILRSEGVRRYGIEIGLKDTRNYRELVRLERDWLVAVVSACKPLAFEQHSWWFPFVGEVPYLGFFDEADAKQEAQALREAGLDVWVRRADGFSTLGALADPLFSFMADYPDYRLANLILHEQTHATVWKPGAVAFNEQLASFVGQQAARDYLIETQGAASAAYRALEDSAHDQDLFVEDLAGLRARLQALYAQGGDAAELTRAKEDCLAAWKREFAESYGGRYRSQNYRGVAELPINNAFIEIYHTYTGRLGLFEAVYARKPVMPAFLSAMAEAAASDDPYRWMEDVLRRPAGD